MRNGKALVIEGGSLPCGLATVRSLGRRRVKVEVAPIIETSLARFSRYCSAFLPCPNPRYSLRDFVEFIAEVSDKYRIIFCCGDDASYLALSRYRNILPQHIASLFPPYESVEIAFNKTKTLKLAQKLEIPIPVTFVISDAAELNKVGSLINYPVIAKGQSNCIWKNNKLIPRSKTYYISNIEELIAVCRKEYHTRGEFPLIQEYLSGEEVGVFLLLNRGKIRAIFAHRRVLSYDPAGGASVIRESIDLPKQLCEFSIKLLETLKWHGLAMVEFKKDERDGEFKLMEINGRIWGSLALAISSGVDFPWLFYQMTTNGDITPVTSYKVGVRQSYLPAAIIAAYRAWRNRNKLKSRGIRSPSNVDLVKAFWGLTKDDLITLDDPFPILGILVKLLSLRKAPKGKLA